MRFRFGWRKELKGRELLDEALQEADHAGLPAGTGTAVTGGKGAPAAAEEAQQEAPVTLRIMVLGDKDKTGNLYTLFLRSKGYEVLHFPSAQNCALLTREQCSCPREHVCADLFLVDMELENMTGLELIRHQRESGCRAWPWHKAVLSSGLNYRQEQEARALGCMSLHKPFRLKDLLGWVRAVEKSIPPDRKLTPYDELFTPAESQPV